MRKKSRSDKTGSSRLKDRISDMEVDYMKKIGILIMTLIMIIAMSTTSFAFGISASQAEKTALKSAHLSKSKVRSLEVEKDDNGKIFEVEFIRKSNKAEYEFKICASNGRIIKKNIDYKYKPVKSDKKIGKKAAMKKVARSAHVKYSVVRKGRCKIEKTGKEWKYEISFKKGKYKFEYDIGGMNAVQLDENLILRMANGDGHAFTELYQLTSGAVYGFALSILRNREDAEDVMHDAFIKTYTGAVTYKPTGKPLAWILTIVRNLAYNKIRAGKVSEDLSGYDWKTDTAYHEDEADRITDRMVLAQAMNVLDFEERQIFILHAATGLKHREIAEILDLPTGTVLSKYSRAVKKMRKHLEENGGKGAAK